jgi:peptidyl-prolyl cis-trans isomerase C
MAATLLLAVSASLPAAATEFGLAARVDGEGISRERLDRYFEARLAEQGRLVAGIRSPEAFKALKREALDHLVDRELLWQEARRLGQVVTAKEVDAAMARFREEYPDPARRRLELEKGGFTEETYREYVRRELSIGRLVEKKLAPRKPVSDRDVGAFYRENAEHFPGQTEAEVREEIRARLAAERRQAAVSARLAELRAAARIEILIPLGDGK